MAQAQVETNADAAVPEAANQQAQVETNADVTAVPEAAWLSAAVSESGVVGSRLAQWVMSVVIRVVTKAPALSQSQVVTLKTKLKAPEGTVLAPALASAWLGNQWLWLGAALLYTAPFSWLAMLWVVRTARLVMCPKDSLPYWSMVIAPPALETDALGAMASRGWQMLGDQIKKADELRVAPPGALACWWGMPVAVILLGPQSLFGTAATLMIGATVACAIEMASQILAAQLVRKASVAS